MSAATAIYRKLFASYSIIGVPLDALRLIAECVGYHREWPHRALWVRRSHTTYMVSYRLLFPGIATFIYRLSLRIIRNCIRPRIEIVINDEHIWPWREHYQVPDIRWHLNARGEFESLRLRGEDFDHVRRLRRELTYVYIL